VKSPFLTLFALFWVIFLIVWVDAGNTKSNTDCPVVISTFITIFDFHLTTPFIKNGPQKIFENGLCMEWGGV
jgi:hypothetical protein